MTLDKASAELKGAKFELKKQGDQTAIFTSKLSVSNFKRGSSFIFNELYGFIFLKFETLRDCRSYLIYCVRCLTA